MKSVGFVVMALAMGCGAPHGAAPKSRPDSAPRGGAGAGVGAGVVIDRFSARAGHIMVRTPGSRLPGPDQPIDFDDGFITHALGPDGAPVRYYHFDIQSPTPALVYRFVKAGTREPLAGQHDVVDVIPGDDGYSDFWRIAWVEAPADLAPDTIRSAADIVARGLTVTLDDAAMNCPIVPAGSRAAEGVDGPPLTTSRWYRGARVSCLDFRGAPLLLDEAGKVPTSPIYVSFAKNPGSPGGGPASGFRVEPGSRQTHNVVFSVPGDLDYSPLWAVHIYDNLAFDAVRDATSAGVARLVVPGGDGPLVNCPIVFLGSR